MSLPSKIIIIIGYCILLSCLPAYGAANFRTTIQDAGLFDPDKVKAKIEYQLDKDASEIEVLLVDFQGRTVDRITYVEILAGDHFISWEGLDESGKRLPGGRYQIVINVLFEDGETDSAIVSIRIASLSPQSGIQIPEPLPPEKHLYKINGSLSSFYRSDENDYSGNGEIRFRSALNYHNDGFTAKGSFSALQNFDGEETSFNGTQAMLEKRWENSSLKGVFRKGLKAFNDPMQLFSDFRTERRKIGMSAEHQHAQVTLNALLFQSEGDVESREQGMAARIVYGQKNSWQLGASYTLKRADSTTGIFNDSERETSHAAAIDIRLPVTDSLNVLLEAAGTRNTEEMEDAGYLIRAEYDLGQVRFSGGYIDLGEDFDAVFADPLHHVERDASGLEASIDYFMPKSFWKFQSVAATLRFFNLNQRSNDEKIQEVDGSLRLIIAEKNNIFTSVLFREDEIGTNLAMMGSLTHKWNDEWSTRVQGNYSATDNSSTIRSILDTSFRKDKNNYRLSLDYIKRDIDYARQSPYQDNSLRLDVNHEYWGIQLQGKYSQNNEDTGVNFFGRLEYKPIFLHRYQISAYLSLGNRAAFSFEERIEAGMEVNF